MTSRGSAMAQGSLDSVSAVQAKLNMFAAYEEELAGRKAAVPELDSLLQKITALGCPPMRQFSLSNRLGVVKERFGKIDELGARYEQLLREALAKQQSLDEMRVSFAKRAEALNRWMESRLDTLTEIIVVDSMSEADQQGAELDAFASGELPEQEAQLAALCSFQQDLIAGGALDNPYSRFKVAHLQEFMGSVHSALGERREGIKAAHDTQQQLDEHKRGFASAAEAVVAFARAEKQSVEMAAPAIAISPDDSASITRGQQMLSALREMQSPSLHEQRLAKLQPAQELSDLLVAAAELDNPYTDQSMGSLKSLMENLSKVIRDKISFIEGQLARAEAHITPEQYEEIKTTFEHFDHSQDGHLNMAEFLAATRALDFELSEAEEEATFNKYATAAGSDEQPALTLESFTTFFLEQYKSRDTFDDLLQAFKTLSGGKEAVKGADVKAFVPEAECAYLLEKLGMAEERLEDELDFNPFVAHVYGK